MGRASSSAPPSEVGGPLSFHSGGRPPRGHGPSLRTVSTGPPANEMSGSRADARRMVVSRCNHLGAVAELVEWPEVSPEQEIRLAALMRRAQAGDEDAYAVLLTECAVLARRFARTRAGDAPWLDDVVQTTLVSIDRARHTFDADRALGPWFYAIVRRRVVDMQRQTARLTRHEVAMDRPPDLPFPPVVSASDAIDLDRVRQALALLPPRQRDIVEAIQLRDEPTRAIAARLAMTQSAVKVAAHRGYRGLRRMLGDGTADRVREDAREKTPSCKQNS